MPNQFNNSTPYSQSVFPPGVPMQLQQRQTLPQQQYKYQNAQQHPQTATQPSFHAPIAPPPLQTAPLPPGWIAVTDPVSGRVYYANSITGQTTWEPPAPVPPPPPPPPTTIPPPPLRQHPLPVNNNNFAANIVPSVAGTFPFQNPEATRMLQPHSTGVTVDAATQQEIMINNCNSIQVPNTLNIKGLLIPSTRALITNELLSFNATSTSTLQDGSEKELMKQLEFSELSSGTVADLARVQTEYRMEQLGQTVEEDDVKKQWYYEPIKAFELPIVSKTPHIEPGRVEIRLVSLMDALGKIE